MPAGTLSGTTLASNVVTSSLTSIGTLAGLTVNGTIALNNNNNATTSINTGSSTSDVTIGGASNEVGIGGAPSGSYKLEVFGKLKTNAINETSDVRYKKDIKTVENALDKVLALRGVTYLWKTDEFPDKGFDSSKQLGLIAQEVEKIVPEVVKTDEKGFKTVEYSKLVALFFEAFKEQQKQLDKLSGDKDRIKKLEEEMSAIRKLLETLTKDPKPAKGSE